MPLNPGVVVPAPALSPPPQNLLAIVARIANGAGVEAERWIGGMSWAPEPCGPLDKYALCNGESKAGGRTRVEADSYEPFTLVARDECSAFGFDAADYEGRARRHMAAHASAGVEEEFWTGELVPTNFHLADATRTQTVGTALTPARGLAALVQALADARGGRGMIHARPYLVQLWMDSGSIHWRTDHWETAQGHVVVPGEGYPGTGPAGEAIAGGVEWAYATQMLQVYEGPVALYPAEFSEAFDRTNNVVRYYAEQAYGIVHNHCAAPNGDDRASAVSINVTL